VIDQIAEAFRTGGGVRLADYPDPMFTGIDRFTAGWFDNLLIQQWLPAVPDALTMLERGCRLADVGTGHGKAVVKMAQAFPRSTFVGYDAHGPSVERAAANVRSTGMGDRVHVRHLDVVNGLPEKYDVITTFDVMHDAVDPAGLLRAIREGLAPGGVYLCLEINPAHQLSGEPNPVGALLYGFSVLLCMTTSLAEGGAGLGTLGVDEAKLCELGTAAGFGSVRAVPLENPFNTLYELRA
jgi:2-polyprenyl-3-methyl-5-hydroxy-6-metoxy-1,4-benzoquinol methylase